MRSRPLIFVLMLVMLGASSALAQTTFTVTTTNDSGPGSLRQAILDANANPGADQIHFDIPGDGVRTITVGSPDLSITDPVTIDGLTQPGTSCDPWPPTLLIEITGASASRDLLNLSDGAGGSVIRGLVLNNFSNGIDISGADGVRIECNFIGTNSAGTAVAQPSGNLSEGITMTDASDVVIGGPGPGQRNLISGSSDEEIEVNAINSVVTGLVIQGNYIGTDVTGTIVITDGDEGIDIGAVGDGVVTGALIGGTDHDEGVCNRACNVIAGYEEGIKLFRTTGVTIQGNHIGLDATGTVVLGGVEEGVDLSDASNTTIGGTEPGAGNVIAGFGEEGIRLYGSATDNALGNAFLGNAIYGNGDLGIDIAPPGGVGTGVTANDAGDADEGGNRLQNFPELASAIGDNAGMLTITYTVPSAPANSTYPLRVEFFLADADGMEGRAFLGSASYEMNEAEQEVEAAFMPAAPIEDGDRLVATATDADGNTSEFSASIAVTAPANRPPTAQDDTATTTEDTPVEINVLSNDTDPDGDNLTVTVTAAPANGTAEVLADQRIRYTPADDFTGEDVFTYQIDDGRGGTAEATVTITVNASNAAPTAPQIISPADGAEVFIGGAPGEDPLDPEATLAVAWAESTDPDSDDLTYTWQMAATEDFANLLFSADTGTETQFETTLGTLAGLLDDAGIELGAAVTLFHRVVVSDGMNETTGSAVAVTLVRGTLVGVEEERLPSSFVLEANYPNPFNPQTTIHFALPQASEVRLVVYDMVGREVARLVEGVRSAGRHEAVFDAAGLPTGVYLYRLEADGFVQTRRMLLVK